MWRYTCPFSQGRNVPSSESVVAISKQAPDSRILFTSFACTAEGNAGALSYLHSENFPSKESISLTVLAGTSNCRLPSLLRSLFKAWLIFRLIALILACSPPLFCYTLAIVHSPRGWPETARLPATFQRLSHVSAGPFLSCKKSIASLPTRFTEGIPSNFPLVDHRQRPSSRAFSTLSKSDLFKVSPLHPLSKQARNHAEPHPLYFTSTSDPQQRAVRMKPPPPSLLASKQGTHISDPKDQRIVLIKPRKRLLPFLSIKKRKVQIVHALCSLFSYLTRLPPTLQLIVTSALYAFHLLILSKTTLPFPIQMIPNDLGLFQSISLDSLCGFLSFAATCILRKFSGRTFLPAIANIQNPPWIIPKNSGKQIFSILSLLMVAYLGSGYFALVFEWVLYFLAAGGVPISIAMHRSLQVLLGHLLWVSTGCLILSRGLFPFFPPLGKWYRLQWQRNWVWWAVGGYYGSSWLFNLSDFINQFLLPPSAAVEDESIVSKMINPENNDIPALLVGAIAPCISAPWWEEVLYRGFTLPSLTVVFSTAAALPISAILFAAHHMNLHSLLPLTILGWTWAIFYACSQNLLVTILIHAMWNSRIFIGSLLGI
ncbi:CAAX amino terminal protease family protein [Cardiosporidium cionae]|uniref:CAAX amino terminal protease family protein n=1 Tax=Cardiosporidium cionae TaxID=476202 RepID=A0ABQ7J7Y0_9APIC|nr:CAAX amino terminal protease family protein [Cardiosporidium cionae]|eukprot:KAF8820100.1 CAAX amino terminal protease family protein [Cardiosporidium cionae]